MATEEEVLPQPPFWFTSAMTWVLGNLIPVRIPLHRHIQQSPILSNIREPAHRLTCACIEAHDRFGPIVCIARIAILGHRKERLASRPERHGLLFCNWLLRAGSVQRDRKFKRFVAWAGRNVSKSREVSQSTGIRIPVHWHTRETPRTCVPV
jgi:hypothetical protein